MSKNTMYPSVKIVAFSIACLLSHGVFAQLSDCSSLLVGEADTMTMNTMTTPFPTIYKSVKIQYLFTAAELISSADSCTVKNEIEGVSIESLDGGFALLDIQMRMANTTATSLSQLNSAVSATPVLWSGMQGVIGLGLQNFMFNGVFDWDGVSNIILEICFNRTSIAPGLSPRVPLDTNLVSYKTAYVLNNNGNVDGCSFTNSFPSSATRGVNNTRPVMEFLWPSVTISVEEYQLKDVVPFPNPADNELYIPISDHGIENIEFYDLTGKAISVEQVEHSTGIRIDTSGLHSGLYLIRIRNEDGSIAMYKVGVWH